MRYQNASIWGLLLLAPFITACMSEPYVPYRPIIRSQDQLVVASSLPSSDHLDNIKQVFDLYKVPYQEVDQELLIPSKLWQDQELMWNYTTKTNDPEWLKQQREDGWIQ